MGQRFPRFHRHVGRRRRWRELLPSNVVAKRSPAHSTSCTHLAPWPPLDQHATVWLAKAVVRTAESCAARGNPSSEIHPRDGKRSANQRPTSEDSHRSAPTFG